MPDFNMNVKNGDQEGVPDGTLEDLRVFWKSLGNSE